MKRIRRVLLVAALVLLALLWSVLWPFAGVPAGRLLGLLMLLAVALPVAPSGAATLLAAGTTPGARATRATFAGGLIALALALLFLEWRQPFYFATDDNLSQFGPVMTQGCRSFFHGTFPTWNPYQGLGQPTTVTGVYALTYPLTYVSWLIAAGLLRNEGALIEVFCILHILIGYLAMCRLVHRHLHVRPVLAALAGLAFGLSGFFLVCGRSWYYMVPLALWVPVIAERTATLIRLPRLWSALGAGIALGLFFHAGNAQMWVYALIFYAVIAAVVVVYRFAVGAAWWRATTRFAAGGAVAVVIAAPLLIPQSQFARDIARSVWGKGIVMGLGSLVLPLPFISSPHPNTWTDEGRAIHMGELYFLGTATTLAALWGLGRTFRRLFDAAFGGLRLTRAAATAAVLSVGLLVALELGLGEASWSWPAMSTLPGFDKFSNPFKFLPFVSFFCACLGALVIERSLRAMPRLRASVVLWSIVAVTAGLTVCHVQYSDSTFYTYGDRPWPRLVWPAKLREQPVRLASVYPGRSNEAGYVEALGQNFASIYAIPSFESYDPLVSFKPESAHPHDAAHWADYGITHVVMFHDMDAPLAAAMNLQRLFTSGQVTVYAAPHAQPLAWQEDAPQVRLEPRWSGNGFTIAGLGGVGRPRVLVVNVLQRAGFVATDGTGARLATARDPLGRLIVKLKAGSAAVKVVYQPRWKLGYLLVLALLSLGGLLIRWPLSPGRVRGLGRYARRWKKVV